MVYVVGKKDKPVVAALDFNGTPVWQKAFDISDDIVSWNSVIALSDGGIAVSRSCRILRFSSVGAVTWEMSKWQAAGQCDFSHIVAVKGGYIISGIGGNGAMVKIDGSGNPIWSVGSGIQQIRSMSQFADDSVVVVGRNDYSDGTTTGEISVLSPMGAVLFKKTIAKGILTVYYAVATSPDRSFVAVGGVKYAKDTFEPQLARFGPWGIHTCASAGLCAALTPASCTDGNACTYDTCDPLTGCVSLSVPNYCNDQNPCTTDSCAPKTGCINTPVADQTPCTDSNSCTSPDKCLAGKCAAPPTDCDDKNPCTTDTCDPATGCAHAAKNSGPCDDLNPCTFGDACTAPGTCKPGVPLVDGSNCGGGKTCSAGVCGP